MVGQEVRALRGGVNQRHAEQPMYRADGKEISWEHANRDKLTATFRSWALDVSQTLRQQTYDLRGIWYDLRFHVLNA